MLPQVLKVAGVFVVLGLLFLSFDESDGQAPQPVANADVAAPVGVEVLARGPVHEAFASPAVEPKATPFVAKKPPAPIDEMPPDEKPEGDSAWIPGYWAFDDETNDFLWVSGCWRTKPPGKEWMAGYWRDQNDQWQYVPGFWTNATPPAQPNQPNQPSQQITYYAAPPAPPQVAPPGEPPAVDAFFVPGNYVWHEERFVWRAGYWGRIREGHVWVPSHYRWTPHGYVFIPGYWDLVVTRRGVLYTPVSINLVVVGPRFVYTPRYAVCDTVVLDSLFVRASFGHYYFGDYYGPAYVRFGFESCAVYSRRCYDPVFVYARYEHRHDPRWFDGQITLVLARNAGRAPCPPRTLALQVRVGGISVIAPTRVVVEGRGQRTVVLEAAHRVQIREAVHSSQRIVIEERRTTEKAAVVVGKPHVAAVKVTFAATVPVHTAPVTTGIPAHKGPLPPPKGPIAPVHTGLDHPSISNIPASKGPLPPPKGPLILPKKGPDDKKKGSNDKKGPN